MRLQTEKGHHVSGADNLQGQESVTRSCNVLQRTFRPFTRACSSMVSTNKTLCWKLARWVVGCVARVRSWGIVFSFCCVAIVCEHRNVSDCTGGHGDSSTKSLLADFDVGFDHTSLEIAAAHPDVFLLLCMRRWTEKRTYVSQTSFMNSTCSLGWCCGFMTQYGGYECLSVAPPKEI